jgi:hypothetical protein
VAATVATPVATNPDLQRAARTIRPALLSTMVPWLAEPGGSMLRPVPIRRSFGVS